MQHDNDGTCREGIRPLDVCSVVEEYDDKPSQCTMYPKPESGHGRRLSSWITASGEAFVDRDELR